MKNPLLYNVTMSLAVEASASVPNYFKPKKYVNGYNETEVLVDGAVIADNPSMYAFLMASDMNTEKNIRVISIGNGKTPIKKLDTNGVSTVNWIS
jgi:patatin-like phospholipase/acyl hydrolase